MKIQTGKAKKYRYYVCGGCADKGRKACDGVRMPEADLDAIVLENFAEHVLGPARLSKMLSALLSRTKDRKANIRGQILELDREMRTLRGKLDNLYGAVGDGAFKRDASLGAHINRLQEKLEELIRLKAHLGGKLEVEIDTLKPEQIDAFGKALRDRLLDAAHPEFRRAYLRALVTHVDVSREEIRITGPKAALLAAAQAAGPDEPVLTFEQDWRTRHDSNV